MIIVLPFWLLLFLVLVFLCFYVIRRSLGLCYCGMDGKLRLGLQCSTTQVVRVHSDCPSPDGCEASVAPPRQLVGGGGVPASGSSVMVSKQTRAPCMNPVIGPPSGRQAALPLACIVVSCRMILMVLRG